MWKWRDKDSYTLAIAVVSIPVDFSANFIFTELNKALPQASYLPIVINIVSSIDIHLVPCNVCPLFWRAAFFIIANCNHSIPISTGIVLLELKQN